MQVHTFSLRNKSRKNITSKLRHEKGFPSTSHDIHFPHQLLRTRYSNHAQVYNRTTGCTENCIIAEKKIWESSFSRQDSCRSIFCTFKSKSDSRHLFQIKLKRDFTLATADVTINLHTKIQDALKHVLRVLHGREVPLSANMHFRDFFSGITLL